MDNAVTQPHTPGPPPPVLAPLPPPPPLPTDAGRARYHHTAFPTPPPCYRRFTAWPPGCHCTDATDWWRCEQPISILVVGAAFTHLPFFCHMPAPLYIHRRRHAACHHYPTGPFDLSERVTHCLPPEHTTYLHLRLFYLQAYPHTRTLPRDSGSTACPSPSAHTTATCLPSGCHTTDGTGFQGTYGRWVTGTRGLPGVPPLPHIPVVYSHYSLFGTPHHPTPPPPRCRPLPGTPLPTHTTPHVVPTPHPTTPAHLPLQVDDTHTPRSCNMPPPLPLPHRYRPHHPTVTPPPTRFAHVC